MRYLSIQDQINIARTDRRHAREGVATAMRDHTYPGLVAMLRYRATYQDQRPGTKPHIFRRQVHGRWYWAAADCKRGPHPALYH